MAGTAPDAARAVPAEARPCTPGGESAAADSVPERACNEQAHESGCKGAVQGTLGTGGCPDSSSEMYRENAESDDARAQDAVPSAPGSHGEWAHVFTASLSRHQVWHGSGVR